MKRLAIFSDIHGNAAALRAVLSDIDAAGIEERYCLGDLIGYGPRPTEVIEIMRSSGIPTIPGNYDAGVSTRAGDCGCYYATDAARANGERSYEFTDSQTSETDAEWLRSLPAQRRFEFDGVRVLLVHGSPRKNNEYLLLDRTESQLARLALDADADVVLHGHIHIPYHRSFSAAESGRDDASGTLHYVSSGSVGKPKDGDPRAGWVEVVLGTQDEVRQAAADDPAVAPVGESDVWVGYVVHRLEYDMETVVSEMLRAGLPETLGEALRRA